jgi:enoyl-CoA hydratase/carnithine racemase
MATEEDVRRIAPSLPERSDIPMELKVTRFTVDDAGVATVWLHRPERRNSWTGRMHGEYRWICKQLDDDPKARVIVVRGSGETFCVGADQRALAGYVETGHYDPALAPDAERPGYGVRPEFDADMAWQLGMRVPMIAAVNGACAGIAVALAAFCDLRFAVEGAKVTTAAPRLGLPAEYGLSWILPRLIGATHAADLLLTGRVVLAEELKAMGFFNEVLPRSDFDRHVDDYAHMIATLSPQAVTTAKRQLWADLLHGDPRAAVEESRALTGKLMQHPDYAEGVAALLEKRPPRFDR